jgi:hypothetical protein
MRPPDMVIGDPKDPYLRRWWVIPRNRWCNVYLHQILRSDDDRALHDHPWPNVSIVVKGRYEEITIESGYGRWLRAELESLGKDPKTSWGWSTVTKVRKALSVVFRRATTPHRLVVRPGESAWTLFITGPRVRDWGFHFPQAWVPFRKAVDPSNPGLRRRP